MFGGMKMDEYNGFESKEEYLQHIKKLFYKNGMKCMILSIVSLLLLFAIGPDKVREVTGIPDNIYWLMQKIITGCFLIGVVGCLISFWIEDD